MSGLVKKKMLLTASCVKEGLLLNKVAALLAVKCSASVMQIFFSCLVAGGMCSSCASYTHPGKEEVHRQSPCMGGGSCL